MSNDKYYYKRLSEAPNLESYIRSQIPLVLHGSDSSKLITNLIKTWEGALLPIINKEKQELIDWFSPQKGTERALENLGDILGEKRSTLKLETYRKKLEIRMAMLTMVPNLNNINSIIKNITGAYPVISQKSSVENAVYEITYSVPTNIDDALIIELNNIVGGGVRVDATVVYQKQTGYEVTGKGTTVGADGIPFDTSLSTIF